MRELIVASANKGKIQEIQSIFEGIFVVKSMADAGVELDIEETGSTFTENALIKARFLHKLLKKAVISDDSGLEVEALNNEPGIYSARYARHGDDDANTQKLLKNLGREKNRKARFISAIAFIDEQGNEVTTYGTAEGEILQEKAGTNGFGYDPVFYSYELKKSYGVATAEEKNKVSHRYRALKSLLEKI